MMSCRALKMSMLSSNVATTCDSPNFEIERTFCRPGKPLTASSTGTRDLRLGFLRVQRRRRGVDLHLHRRRVREGVNRQNAQGPPADDDERRRQHADQQAVLEREE